jgi:hypothetical protein
MVRPCNSGFSDNWLIMLKRRRWCPSSGLDDMVHRRAGSNPAAGATFVYMAVLLITEQLTSVSILYADWRRYGLCYDEE